MVFLLANSVFTLVTQYLGPYYYGYGFAMAMLRTSLIGLKALSAKLDTLEYETFMMQHFS